MLPERSSAMSEFLYGIQVVDERPVQILLSARYATEQFSQDLYDLAGVPMPPELSAAVPKRKSEFLAGRSLANEAMQRLGLAGSVVGRGAHGEPLWPAGITGSITHSGGVVAVWLTSEDWTPGLDIEHMPSFSALEAIRSVVLTAAEKEMELDDRQIVALFSAKEALFKGLFPAVGRRFGFGSAELVSPPGQDGLCLRLTKQLAASLCEGDKFDVGLTWQDMRVISQFAGPRGITVR